MKGELEKNKNGKEITVYFCFRRKRTTGTNKPVTRRPGLRPRPEMRRDGDDRTKTIKISGGKMEKQNVV